MTAINNCMCDAYGDVRLEGKGEEGGVQIMRGNMMSEVILNCHGFRVRLLSEYSKASEDKMYICADRVRGSSVEEEIFN